MALFSHFRVGYSRQICVPQPKASGDPCNIVRRLKTNMPAECVLHQRQGQTLERREEQTPRDDIVRGVVLWDVTSPRTRKQRPESDPIGIVADLALSHSTFAVVSSEACSRQPLANTHGF